MFVLFEKPSIKSIMPLEAKRAGSSTKIAGAQISMSAGLFCVNIVQRSNNSQL